MSLTPLTFTGVSKFSTDFQTILQRTVAIASQPIQSMQSEQANLLAQKQLLTNMNGSVAALADVVSALGGLGGTKALSATSSDQTKVSVSSTTAAAPATYTISEITSIARNASASSAGYANSTTETVSANGSVRLTFGGESYDTTLSSEDNNLVGLRDWINSQGAGVTATILTTGTGVTPYYLSITANSSGLKPITLVDEPEGAATNLLAVTDNGANAEFKVNGVAVSKASNLINDVVSGLAFTIGGTTGLNETVTLTLATDRSMLSDALESFVAAYNAVVDQVDAQIGENAGLLTGDIIVREVQQTLRAVSGYLGAGVFASLTDLSIEFDDEGKVSFDPDAFATLNDTGIEAALEFLGSESTGFGSLAAELTSISDPVTGLIRTQQDFYGKRDETLSDQIDIVTERVTNLQLSTSQRLQVMDALLAHLESQQTVLNASIQGLYLTLFGKNDE
jgi:flagellar hook-associated protein 2